MKIIPLVFFLIVFLSGCKDSGEKELLRGETVKELTEAELEDVVKFARQFAVDAGEGNADAIARAFNTRGFVNRVLDGIEFPSDQFKEFMDGVRQGVSQRPGGVGWGFVNRDLEFMKLLPFQGMKMPLFRLRDDDGLTYLILLALPDDSGRIQAHDSYALSNGEWSSLTTRRLILPAVKAQLGSGFARAFKKDEGADILEHLEKAMELVNASQKGDVAGMQKAYRNLPEKLRKDRYFWTLYLASLVDDVDLHQRESREFQAAFPDDAGVALMLIDADFNREDWEGIHRKFATIRRFVDGDPYLDHFESSIFIIEGDHESGLDFANRALSGDPESEDYWWNAFTCLAALERHPELAGRLEGYEKQFGVRLTPDDFAEGILDRFLESPEGRAYLGR